MFASEFSLISHTCSSSGQRCWFLLWALLSVSDLYTFTFTFYFCSFPTCGFLRIPFCSIRVPTMCSTGVEIWRSRLFWTSSLLTYPLRAEILPSQGEGRSLRGENGHRSRSKPGGITIKKTDWSPGFSHYCTQLLSLFWSNWKLYLLFTNSLM